MSKKISELIKTERNWFHTMELAPGVFTPGIQDPSKRLELFGIPEDLSGKRVLEIGPMEGYYSFICEERGADVTAIDIRIKQGLRVAAEIRNSKIKTFEMSVYELSKEKLGTFDIVLFMGVLYHLRHPLLALDAIYDVTDDLLIAESQVCDRWFINGDGETSTLADFDPRLEQLPLAQFYPGDELGNSDTNWWSPNEIGFQTMLESSGFSATLHTRQKARAIFHCHRSERPKGVEFKVIDRLRQS